MKIAVDAMGSDNAPAPDVAGGVRAAREFNETILLVGDEQQIKAELAKHNTDGLAIEVIHAAQQVTMTDKPAEVGKEKPESSMHVGMNLVKTGDADAFVTGGNTGAAMAIATLHTLGRIKGVRRPAMSAVGDLNGHLVTVLDIGANTDTKLEWLKQFGLMGNIYAQQVLGVASPRVGLLANGEEDGKGDQLVREANPAFREMGLNFIGNVEPKDLLSGRADVIVTDGYVGNILLKTYEAAIASVFNEMRVSLTRDWRGKVGAWLARPYLRSVLKRHDPTQYGGAPLLGVNGIVIITHGGSDAAVIRNTIKQAIRAKESNLIEVIQTGLTATDADKE